MKETLKGKLDISGIKRCYVNMEIKLPCPNCGEEIAWEGADTPLYYPKQYDDDSVSLYCEPCDLTFVLPITILGSTLEIQFDRTKIKEE